MAMKHQSEEESSGLRHQKEVSEIGTAFQSSAEVESRNHAGPSDVNECYALLMDIDEAFVAGLLRDRVTGTRTVISEN